MPVPSPRSKLLPARGNYSDLAANVAELLDGEICYAIDQDQYYQKEGSILVSVGASKAQGLLADTALQDAPSDGSEYVRKDGSWAVATGGGGGGPASTDDLPEGSTNLYFPEAPADGSEYVRKDGSWAVATGGGAAGVSSIIAGSGISVDQATGDVTITATGGGGGSGATQLNELTDVDLGTPPANGQVLVFDSTSGTFKPGDSDAINNAGQPVITYSIGANGTSAYLFSGAGFPSPTQNPDLTVVRGQSYLFDNTTGAHPFQIQTEAGTGGTAYADGVSGNNTIGQVLLTVPYNAPDELFYQCTAHAAMGGKISVLTVDDTPAGATDLDGLSDVDTTTYPPVDGQALVWSDVDSSWIPGDAASGGDGTTYGPWAPLSYNTFNTDGDQSSEASTDLQDFAGPVSTVDQKVGAGCLDGRGNGNRTVAGDFGTNILTGDAFSFSFWFYHDGVTEGISSYIVGCTKPGVNTPTGLVIRLLTNQVNLPQDAIDRGVDQGSLAFYNGSTSGYLVGTDFSVFGTGWRHYIVSHDGNGLYRLFVDGVEHDTEDKGTPEDFTDAGIYGTHTGEYTLMGGRADSGRNYGMLDNFAVYTTDITAGVTSIPVTALSTECNVPFSYVVAPPIGATTDLSDFSPAPGSDGQVPVITGGKYVPTAPTLGLNSDVDVATAAPTDGQVLSYDGSNWKPSDPGAGEVQATPVTPYRNINFDAYGESQDDFVDWADGLDTSGGAPVGAGFVNYKDTAGTGAQDSWFIGDSALWIEFWMKHDETAPGDQIVFGIAEDGSGTNVGGNGFAAMITFDSFYLPSNTPHASALAITTDGTAQGAVVHTTNTNPGDGAWHHYAVYVQPAAGPDYSTNDGKVILYVDGKKEMEGDNGSTITYTNVNGSTGDVITLMRCTDQTKKFRGALDNFRVFQSNLPVPLELTNFTPNTDSADTAIGYGVPKKVDSTLNLTDYSSVPSTEGQTVFNTNGVYTPGTGLQIVAFINSYYDNFPTPYSSDDDLSVIIGSPQVPGMCIISTVDGVMYIYTGAYDFYDETGGWVTIPLGSGGGAPA